MNPIKRKINNLFKAYERLEEALKVKALSPEFESIIRDSIIQRFEFSFEMSWKTMRAILIDRGIQPGEVASPKTAIRSAFKNDLIRNGDVWIEMTKCRNNLSHDYNEEEAIVIANRVRGEFMTSFYEFRSLLQELLKEEYSD